MVSLSFHNLSVDGKMTTHMNIVLRTLIKIIFRSKIFSADFVYSVNLHTSIKILRFLLSAKVSQPDPLYRERREANIGSCYNTVAFNLSCFNGFA